MAQIDPNIALGFRLPQIQDPLAATARAQEVGVNALKMQEMQRGIESQNKLRQLYSQGVDVSTPEGFKQIAAIDPTAALKLRTDALQARKLEGETQKLNYDLDEKRMGIMRERSKDLLKNTSNENYIAHIQDGVRDGLISPEQAQRSIQLFVNIPPNQRADFIKQQMAKAEEVYKMNTVSEYQKQSLGIQRENQRMQYDPELQGRIAGAKTTAQEAAKREIAGNIDVTSNRKALAQAGYDVATGKDEITDLIKKSTGSYLGKAIDIGGRVFGQATEGSEALAALEQKANAITFGLLNGKLGAGISKSDAELVASLVGRLGDGTLPVDDRLAAWNSAKNMMKNLGMVAEPTGATKPTSAAPAVKTPALPAGFKLDTTP